MSVESNDEQDLADTEGHVQSLRSEIALVRAKLEETTTNAIIHEEIKDGGRTRVLELIHDLYYKEAENVGLADVCAQFGDPDEPPRKKRRGRRSKYTHPLRSAPAGTG